MADDIVLDPGSRVPDPPLDDESVLEWARDLTEKLRNDHSDSVDRIENLVMSDERTASRPEAKGSRRFFHDEYSGTVYLDSMEDGEPKWIPINTQTTYSPSGQGVNVIYSTSLPVAGITSGYFSYDEEVWDEDSYWSSGTDVEIPSDGMYQVQFLAEISALTSDDEIIISGEINGADLAAYPDKHVVWLSDAGTEKIRLNFLIDLVDGDILKMAYSADSTFTLSECYLIVTPMTEDTGGGTQISDHGSLAGLNDDDHSLYLLASDATNRTTFATNWTDLTDGGETTLHEHAVVYTGDICLPQGSAFQVKDSGDNCRDLISMSSDNTYVGLAAYDMVLNGLTVDINSAGEITIDSGAANNITVTATNDLRFTATRDFEITTGAAYDVVIKTHGSRLQGATSASAEVDMIGVTSVAPADRVAIGNGSLNLWLDSVSVFMGPTSGNASSLYWYTGSGSWVEFIEWDGSDFHIGDPAESLYIDADSVLDLSATNIYLRGHVNVPSGFYLIATNATSMRIPYLGSAPGGLQNGEMWMENDGLHVYYGGSEHTLT